MAFIPEADYDEFLRRRRDGAESSTPAVDPAWQQATQLLGQARTPAPATGAADWQQQLAEQMASRGPTPSTSSLSPSGLAGGTVTSAVPPTSPNPEPVGWQDQLAEQMARRGPTQSPPQAPSMNWADFMRPSQPSIPMPTQPMPSTRTLTSPITPTPDPSHQVPDWAVNLAGTAFDWASRPQRALNQALAYPYENNLQTAGQGKAALDVLRGNAPGKWGAELLKVTQPDMPEPVRDVVGLASDITLDPLNWPPGAAIPQLGQLGVMAGKGAARLASGIGQAAAPALRQAASAVGEALPDVRQAIAAGEAGSAELPRVNKAADTRRFYHGTGSTFETPNIAKGDKEALYGSGYYLTDEPKVASSYASTRSGRPSSTDARIDLWRIDRAKALSQIEKGRYDPALGAMVPLTPEQIAQKRLFVAEADSEIERLQTMPFKGANVRAVDIPRDLPLFDTTAANIEDAVLDSIDAALPQHQRVSFQISIKNIAQNNRGRITGDDVYDTLADVTNSKANANATLERAGFDGLEYAGGRHMPLLDEQGRAIEHSAVVVFPGGLPKIRNAISGTIGGSPPEVGGAVVGAVAYQDDPNLTPEENLARRAAYAGGGAALGNLGRRLGGSSRLGGTVKDVGRPDTIRSTGKERAATGLTKQQELYLTGKLENVAPKLPEKIDKYAEGQYGAGERVSGGTTIHIPDDGSVTVHSQEQANALHYRVTGKPIEGMPKPKDVTKAAVGPAPVGEPYRFNPYKEADDAMQYYGHPTRAADIIEKQLANLAEAPETVRPTELQARRLQRIIAELRLRAEGRTTGNPNIMRYGSAEQPYNLETEMARLAGGQDTSQGRWAMTNEQIDRSVPESTPVPEPAVVPDVPRPISRSEARRLAEEESDRRRASLMEQSTRDAEQTRVSHAEDVNAKAVTAGRMQYEEMVGDEPTLRGLMEWYYRETGNTGMEARMRQGDTIPRIEVSKAQRMAQEQFRVRAPEPAAPAAAPPTPPTPRIIEPPAQNVETEAQALTFQGDPVTLELSQELSGATRKLRPKIGAATREYVARMADGTPVDRFTLVQWQYGEPWKPQLTDTLSDSKRALRRQAADMLNGTGSDAELRTPPPSPAQAIPADAAPTPAAITESRPPTTGPQPSRWRPQEAVETVAPEQAAAEVAAEAAPVAPLEAAPVDAGIVPPSKPPAAPITAAQAKVLKPAREAAGRGQSLKVWRDDKGVLYVERATGGDAVSYSTVLPDGTVKSGMPEQKASWQVVEEHRAAKTEKAPPKTRVPLEKRVPYERQTTRRPIWEGAPEPQASATQTGSGAGRLPPEPPARPVKYADWEPKDKPLTNPQPLGRPADPLAQLQEALTPTKLAKREQFAEQTDAVLRAMYDKTLDAHKIEDATGIPAHKLAQIVPGSIAHGELLVERNIDPVIKAVGNDVKRLEEYLVTMRMQDILSRSPSARLPGKISGWPGVLRTEDQLKTTLGPERFKRVEDAAKRLWELNDELVLKPRLDAGLLSKTQYTQIKSANPHYASFYREDFAGLQTGMGRGKVASISDAGMQQLDLEGSWRKLDNPLARFRAQVINTQHLIAENKAAKALAQGLLEMEKAAGKGTVGKGAARAPLGTGEQFAKVMGKGAEAEHSNVWGTISYLEDGEKVTVQVPKVFENMAKGLEAEPASFAIRLARAAAFPLRAGAVTFNAAFLPKNVLRDMNSAFYREGLQPLSEDYARGWMAAITKNEDYADAARAGALMSGIVENMKTTESLARASQMGAITVRNPTDVALLLPRLMGKGFGRIERANVVSEQATRIATYQKLRTQGLSELEAAVRARDVTVDFAKSGNWMKVINQWAPFTNAGLQGAANTMRTMRYNPKQAIIGATPLVAATAIAYTWNQRFETAKMIPEREYANNWILIVGEGQKEQDPKYPNKQPEKFPIYARIPKGSIGALLTAPAEMALRFAFMNDDRGILEHLATAAGTMGTALSPVDVSVTSLFPPLVETAIGVQSNYDTFRDRPIVPRGEQDRIPEAQYGPETSKMAIALGEKFRLSPRMIDWAIKDATAGVGAQSLWASDLILGAIGYDPTAPGEVKRQPMSPAEDLARTPLTGGFMGTQNTQAVNRGWDMFDKAVEESNRQLWQNPELRRLGMNIGPVSDTIDINGAKITLTPAERAELQVATTAFVQYALERAMSVPSYSKAPTARQEAVLRDFANKAREMARYRFAEKMPREQFRARVIESYPVPVNP